MKELDFDFKGVGEVSDFGFKQLKSSNHAYVYEISNTNSNRHYEVFERREQQESETVMQGIKINRISKVIYPKSNQFGKTAWCFRDDIKAIACFEEINKRMTNKAFKV